MMPAAVEHALHGIMVGHVLLAGDETGVFDYLGGHGAQTAEEVAAALMLDPDAVARFLRASASVELCTGRPGGRFELCDPVRPYLARAGAHYAGGWLSHIRTVTARTFAALGDSLRTGQPQLEAVLGTTGRSLFDGLYADADRLAGFAASMWNLGFEASLELADGGPLHGKELLVDLGGGSGSFAVAAALKHPSLSAVIFDLAPLGPHAAASAERFGVAPRVTFRAGNFFDDELPPGDAYALGYILSDWTYARGTALLQRVFDALRPGGVVMILERLFDSDGCGPVPTALMDMCMLVETEGRHRSADEYLAWLAAVGFFDCSVRRSSYDKHMVIGIKEDRR